MPLIPSPPDLKPTIIQMQNADSNNNDYNPESSPNLNPQLQSNEQQQKKRRRRSSSSLVSQSEIEKRRREHKTAHSIIEKKRRIRMNREFEALKYLVPACRNNLSSSSNNGEGMYKLTILQATVDYIKYLHNVINIQNDDLKSLKPTSIENDQVLEFANFDIDTEAYRNVENDFDFNRLFDESNRSGSTSSDMNQQSYQSRTSSGAGSLSSTKIRNDSMIDLSKFQSLPSPIITPELYPRSANSSANSNSSVLPELNSFQSPMLKPDFQFPRNPTSVAASSQQGHSPNQILVNSNHSSRVSISSDLSSKLDIINELGAMVDTHETSSVQALLAMKKDGNITSIRSLLN